MSDKVVVNLATGLEDAERVTVALLVGVAAPERGQPVGHAEIAGTVPLFDWLGGEPATVFSY